MAVTGERRTTPDDGNTDVASFLDSVTDDRRRADARDALAIMAEVTGEAPTMWGPSMVGFGHRPYRTADGTERDWFAVGLAPRKTALVFYGLTLDGSHADLLERLGPHRTGKGCVYVTRLDVVDRDVLRALVARAWTRDLDAPEA